MHSLVVDELVCCGHDQLGGEWCLAAVAEVLVDGLALVHHMVVVGLQFSDHCKQTCVHRFTTVALN